METAPARVPLDDQIAEVEREIRQRERLYPRWIEAGKYKKATADKKLDDLRAALVTLQFVAKHSEPLRRLIKTLQQHNAHDHVVSDFAIEELLADPAVRKVMEVFPEAIATAVQPIGTAMSTASKDLFNQ
ncbi:MAG: hypothetical protein HOO99_03975 [Hyphomicrobiaceae bacterium]|nr:hypothetical protein [Hyphomicrobiaceae bacterium]